MNVYIRVNGRGNAWPLELGATDSRHAALKPAWEEYSNTSFSIIGVDGDPTSGKLQWEVLFDIGQGIVPFLVRNGGNRLPETLILSHPHPDHIFGLDWLVQSYNRNARKRNPFPVFASEPCWDTVMSRFDYLANLMTFHQLEFGSYQNVAGVDRLRMMAFPVFHAAHAPGSILVMVEYAPDTNESRDPVRAIFTGDLLCPLLRNSDWPVLTGVKVVFADANARFPWPDSGHWSIVSTPPAQSPKGRVLDDWRTQAKQADLIKPHNPDLSAQRRSFLGQFCADINAHVNPHQSLCLSIFDFAEHIHPSDVQLVHYSGYEDHKHHGQAILTDQQLLDWTQQTAQASGYSHVPSISWGIPKPGDYFQLC